MFNELFILTQISNFYFIFIIHIMAFIIDILTILIQYIKMYI